jgi:hypothetical protein
MVTQSSPGLRREFSIDTLLPLTGGERRSSGRKPEVLGWCR